MFQLMGIDGRAYVTSMAPIRLMDTLDIVYLAETVVGTDVWVLLYHVDGTTNTISWLEVYTYACPLPSTSSPAYIFCADCPSDRTLQAVALASSLQAAVSACDFDSPLVNQLGVAIQTRLTEACQSAPYQCCNSDDAYNHAFYIDLLCVEQGNATAPAFASATNSGDTVYAGASVVSVGGNFTLLYRMDWDSTAGQYDIATINIGSQACPTDDAYIDCRQCFVLDPLQDLVNLNNAVWTCDPYSLLVENLALVPSTLNAPCYNATDYCCATVSSSSSALFTLACSDTLDRSFGTPLLVSGIVGNIDLVYQASMSVSTATDGPVTYLIQYALLKVDNAYQLTSIMIAQSGCPSPVDYNTCAPSCPEPALYAAAYFQAYIARTGAAPQVLTIGTINSETCVTPPNGCCKESDTDTAYIFYTLLGLDGNAIVSSDAPVLESGAFGDPVLTLTAASTINGAAWHLRYLMMLDPDGFTYFIDALQLYQDTCPLPLDGSDGFIDCLSCPT
jgi:hypothetical protein